MFSNAQLILLPSGKAKLSAKGISAGSGPEAIKAAIANHLSAGIDYVPPLRANVHITAPRLGAQELATYRAAAPQLPKSFSWQSSPAVRKPGNQGQCGDCWAWAVSTALGDRIAIGLKAKPLLLSAQALTSCDSGEAGCGGGHIDAPYAYIAVHGLPSEACVPFTDGASSGGSTSPCKSVCADGKPPTQLYYCEKNSEKSLAGSSLDVIKADVMANGPLPVVFFVMGDFIDCMKSSSTRPFQATKDIYICNTEDQANIEGGHAVVIVGWGVEPGPIQATLPGGKQAQLTNVPYWIIRNSWGTTWNGDGHFKFAMQTAVPGSGGIILNRAPGLDLGSSLNASNPGLCGAVTFKPSFSTRPHGNTGPSKSGTSGMTKWLTIGLVLLVVLIITWVVLMAKKHG